MKKYIFIGLGGFAGAMARFAVKSAPLRPGGAFPLNTLVINVLGSFLLAFLLTAAMKSLDRDLKTGISTGFLGAFTTFSTFCKEAFSLMQAGDWLVALSYMVLSAVLGLLSAFIGAFAARKTVRRRSGRDGMGRTGEQG